MADPAPFPDTEESGGEPERQPGAPAWVSVLGIVIVAILVVVVVLLHLFGVLGPGTH